MAILVLFTKTGEGPDTVSYACGFDGNSEEFHFTLGTGDLELRDRTDGEPVPHAVLCARSKAVRMFRETGTWPARGAYCA
ncbi:hypothetical protein ACFOVU_28255 [Nocardiopsis sediminis]|uniref:Uncharacterized protein n=1 Tax=Nocardiopsis sediminis TaxID=1778267 RepID=A0ABV8FWL9_9ACTN